jgi:hypothetical protein
MPFPLAHPAAVLPLRRYCPRYLSFPALVIGSITPDLGYLFGRLHADEFSHRFFPGSFAFCLPVGLLLFVGFHLLRFRLVSLLPTRHRQLLFPICERPPSSWIVIVVSLLIGAWSHLLLDSLTHQDGWIVEHLPALHRSIHSSDGGWLRGYDLLYACCTFFGSAWLIFFYLQSLEAASPCLRANAPARIFACSLFFAGTVLALSLFSRGYNHPVGEISVAVISGLLVIAFLAVTGWPSHKSAGAIPNPKPGPLGQNDSAARTNPNRLSG